MACIPTASETISRHPGKSSIWQVLNMCSYQKYFHNALCSPYNVECYKLCGKSCMVYFVLCICSTDYILFYWEQTCFYNTE